MRVPVKVAKGRRDAVPRSEPTYEVDLTRCELIQITRALEDRMRTLLVNGSCSYDRKRTASAIAVITWVLDGRQ